ncbi:MAG: DUF2436 domain-containing protein [Bacteroidales bacterium]|jgi:hypothetical protein|nr:DUF2436 domain-containing protein [Bacteroidales bacterium]
MKRILILIIFVFCLGYVYSQPLNIVETQTNKSLTDTIPNGYARVSLIAGDYWENNSGYQMLLDSTHSQYDFLYNCYGFLFDVFNPVPQSHIDSVYSLFQYKIPKNADASLNPNYFVRDSAKTITIPAGLYDYAIVNPANNGTRVVLGKYGMQDNFYFESGKHYIFKVDLNISEYGPNYNSDSVRLLPQNDISIDYNVTSSSFGYPRINTLTSHEHISFVVANEGCKTAKDIDVHCLLNGGELVIQHIDSIPVLNRAVVTFTANMSSYGKYLIQGYINYPLDSDSTNNATYKVSTWCLPAPSIRWDFNDCTNKEFADNWVLLKNDNGHFADFPQTIFDTIFVNNNAWEIMKNYSDSTDLMAVSSGFMTDTTITADRWLITPIINLNGNDYLEFTLGTIYSLSPTIDVLVSNGSTDTSDFVLVDSFKGIYNYLIQEISSLSNFTGNCRIAFRNRNRKSLMMIIDNIFIHGNASVGIKNIQKENISLYPNPTNNQFTITNAINSNLKIVDMVGRVVFNDIVKSNNQTISVKNLNKGIYVVEINNKGKISNQKLIIK